MNCWLSQRPDDSSGGVMYRITSAFIEIVEAIGFSLLILIASAALCTTIVVATHTAYSLLASEPIPFVEYAWNAAAITFIAAFIYREVRR